MDGSVDGVGGVDVPVSVGGDAVDVGAQLTRAGAIGAERQHLNRRRDADVELPDLGREGGAVPEVAVGDPQVALGVDVRPHVVGGGDLDLVEVGPGLVVMADGPGELLAVAPFGDVDVAVDRVDGDRVRLAPAQVHRAEEGADLPAGDPVVAPDLEVPVVAHEDLVGDRVVLHAPGVDARFPTTTDRPDEPGALPTCRPRRTDDARAGHGRDQQRNDAQHETAGCPQPVRSGLHFSVRVT